MAIMGEKEEEGLIVNKVLLLNNEVEETKKDDGVTIEEIHEEEEVKEDARGDVKEVVMDTTEELDEGIRMRHVDFIVCSKVTNYNRSSSEPSLKASIPFLAVFGGGRVDNRFTLFLPFPVSMVFDFFESVEPLTAFSLLESTYHWLFKAIPYFLDSIICFDNSRTIALFRFERAFLIFSFSSLELLGYLPQIILSHTSDIPIWIDSLLFLLLFFLYNDVEESALHIHVRSWV